VFSLVQELFNDPVEYHLARGQVYLRTGQVEQAENEAMAALELNNEFARSWMILGQSLEMQGRTGEAMEAYETSGEIAFENEENEIYVMARLALAHLTETLPAMPLQEDTVEPTAEPMGE
jgi:tetratricopeptide (TPR) repeat protein